jgi:hypothetical protein
MADIRENNGCLDWDDSIENDGQEFVTLPEGDYDFTITNFERGRFPGGGKLPACNKATLTLRVENKEGTASIRTDLFLHKSVEWKLSAFFRSVGLKKHGEMLRRMPWDKVVGAKGRAHIVQRSYTGKDGTQRTTNDVRDFLDPKDTAAERFERGEVVDLAGQEMPF